MNRFTLLYNTTYQSDRWHNCSSDIAEYKIGSIKLDLTFCTVCIVGRRRWRELLRCTQFSVPPQKGMMKKMLLIMALFIAPFTCTT